MSDTQSRLEVILDNTIGILLVIFGSALILAFFVMWTWNYVIPSVFNLPKIGYWQAFTLYVLSGLLIKTITITR